MRPYFLNLLGALPVFVASAQAGTLQIQPTSLDFGNVSVAAGPVFDTITITNLGGSTQINGFTPVFGCAEFTVEIGGAMLPLVLGNNESVEVTVGYDPANRQADMCPITVMDDNSVTDTFQLLGDGIAPVLDVTPSLLSFADQVWNGEVHETQNVMVMNVGELPFDESNLGRVLTTGTHFSVGDPIGTFPVQNGDFVLLPVTFDPTSVGAKSDNLNLSLDNDSAEEPNLTVSLSGNGTEAVGAPIASLDHGIRAVGPSPSRGVVWAQVAFDRPGALDVEMFDTSGRLAARTHSIEGGAGTRTVEFNAGSHGLLRSGIYFLRVRFADQVLGVRRIAIVR
jgi:hypothetical protein